MSVQILDNILSDEVLTTCTQEAELSASYRVLHGAGDGSYGFKYSWMVYDSKNKNDKLDGNFLSLWNEISSHIPEKTRIHRCYVNAHTYGVEDAIHEDDPDIEQGLTVIVYLCSAWYPEWFGQTVFWDHIDRMNHNDIVQSVIPKPNRVLVFDKTLPHCVAPLSRRFAGVRLTCMFKLEVLDGDSSNNS
jgi:hypothetical protein